ncbi:MAG: hypothetical protein ACRD1C_12530 [Terriglobales bacterium]
MPNFAALRVDFAHGAKQSFAASYAVTFFYALAGTEAFTVTFASNTIPADCYYAVYSERMF